MYQRYKIDVEDVSVAADVDTGIGFGVGVDVDGDVGVSVCIGVGWCKFSPKCCEQNSTTTVLNPW